MKNIWLKIDAKIDAVGMYRIVSLSLLGLVIYSLCLAIFNLFPYGVAELLVSLATVLTAGFLSNYLFAKLWQVHTNHESTFITSLIVFFVILPTPANKPELLFIPAMVVTLAVLSKYVVVWRRQHLLNPVAAGVVVTMLLYELLSLPPGYFESGWWVGQPSLFVPLVILGAIIVHKVRRWMLVLGFLTTGFIVFLFEEWRFVGSFDSWSTYFLSGPSVFLATFMLTEPFTLPPTKRLQTWYGVIVGFLSQTALFLPVLKMTPEIALVIGNILFWPVRLRQKLYLKLNNRRHIAKDTFEFVFNKPAGFDFKAGQYLEWMLPHIKADSRGVRRYFTVASAPTEPVVRVALRVPKDGSSYKRSLMKLNNGEDIIASQLAGDFVLPSDKNTKLAFIAGGIGVTPFRSHIQFMIDSGVAYDTILFYCANTVANLAYREEFDRATTLIPFKIINVIAKEEVDLPFEQGYITIDMIKSHVPDYLERTWYLSGPSSMVTIYGKLLRELNVPRRQIKKDFFPGLA